MSENDKAKDKVNKALDTVIAFINHQEKLDPDYPMFIIIGITPEGINSVIDERIDPDLYLEILRLLKAGIKANNLTPVGSSRIN